MSYSIKTNFQAIALNIGLVVIALFFSSSIVYGDFAGDLWFIIIPCALLFAIVHEEMIITVIAFLFPLGFRWKQPFGPEYLALMHVLIIFLLLKKITVVLSRKKNANVSRADQKILTVALILYILNTVWIIPSIQSISLSYLFYTIVNPILFLIPIFLAENLSKIIPKILIAVALGATVASIVGIGQFFTGDFYWGTIALRETIHIENEVARRIGGPFFRHNYYGAYLTGAIFITEGVRRNFKNKIIKHTFSIFLFLQFSALLMSGSRGSFLAFIFVFIPFLWWLTARSEFLIQRMLLLLWIPIILFVIWLFFNNSFSEFVVSRVRADASRHLAWSAVLGHIISKGPIHWLFGNWGAGSFIGLSAAGGTTEYPTDNEYLFQLYRGGLLGLGLFLYLLKKSCEKGLEYLKRAKKDILYASVFFSTLAILINSLTVNTLCEIGIGHLFVLNLTLLLKAKTGVIFAHNQRF